MTLKFQYRQRADRIRQMTNKAWWVRGKWGVVSLLHDSALILSLILSFKRSSPPPLHTYHDTKKRHDPLKGRGSFLSQTMQNIRFEGMKPTKQPILHTADPLPFKSHPCPLFVCRRRATCAGTENEILPLNSLIEHRTDKRSSLRIDRWICPTHCSPGPLITEPSRRYRCAPWFPEQH